jgi:hypothetical protein
MYLIGAGIKHTRTIPRFVFQGLQQRRCLVTLTLQKISVSVTCHIMFIWCCKGSLFWVHYSDFQELGSYTQMAR